MNKKVRIALKFFKWVVIAAAVCFLLPVLWFGFQYQNPDEGKIKFFWSGIDALFSKAEFGLGFNKEMYAEFDGIDGPYIIGDTLTELMKKMSYSKRLLPIKIRLSYLMP